MPLPTPISFREPDLSQAVPLRVLSVASRALPPLVLRLAEAAIVVGAFVAAHFLTPSLRPLRDATVAIVTSLVPSLTPLLQPDPPPMRSFGDAAWILLVVTPAILVSLMGLDAFRRVYPFRILAVLSAPVAVTAGLAFGSLTIVGFHLEGWSRVFLTTFGAIAALALMPLRAQALTADGKTIARSGARETNIAVPGPVVSREAAPAAAPVAPLIGGVHDESITKAVETATPHDAHVYEILERIAADGAVVSQRSLANELGIALGLTNLLLKKIAHQGWIRMVRIRPNRVRYLITPAGLAARAQLYRRQLSANLRFYVETRHRIQRTLDSLPRVTPDRGHSSDSRAPRIVVYGTGEVAEIGFVSLHGSGVSIVGIVDDGGRPLFLGQPVSPLESLSGLSIRGHGFDWVLVMTLDDVDEVRRKLLARGVPAAAVHSIL